MFWQWEIFSPPEKNYLYFRKQKPRKKFLIFSQKNCPHISGNGNFKKIPNISRNFLYFRRELPKFQKPKFIIFLQIKS